MPPSNAPTNPAHEELPTPIVAAWHRFLAEPDPVQKLPLLLDTLTVTLKFWAFVLAAEYLHRARFRDAALNDLLEKGWRRPHHSDWGEFIDAALWRFKRARHELVTPHIHDAHKLFFKGSVVPVTVPVLGASGETHATQRLSWFQAFMHYRNNQAHGLTSTNGHAIEELERYCPLLDVLLQASAFLRDYPMIALVREAAGARVTSLNGPAAQVTDRVVSAELLGPILDHIVIFGDPHDRARALPLTPFVTLDRGGVPVCFEGFEAESGHGRRGARAARRLFYATTTGRHHYTHGPLLDYWQRALEGRSTARSVTDREELTLRRLHEIAQAITEANTREVLPPEAELVPRAACDELFAQLALSSCSGAVLVGAVGVGRSVALAAAARRVCESATGRLAFFYRASALDTDDPGEHIARDALLRGVENFKRFLEVVDRTGPAVVYFIIDDLHQALGDRRELIQNVLRMLQQGEGYAWFKLILGARASTVSELRARFFRHAARLLLSPASSEPTIAVASPVIELPPLTREELADLYERLRASARTLPSFESIRDKRWTEILRNPRTLKMFATAADGGASLYTVSTEDVLQHYESWILGRPESNYPRRGLEAVLDGLTRTIHASRRTVVSRERLFAELRGVAGDLDDAYDMLVEQGVIVESLPGAECEVGFVHEPFLAWRLARVLGDLCRDRKGIGRVLRDTVNFPVLREALVMVFSGTRREEPLRALAAALGGPHGGAGEREILCAVGVDVLEALAALPDEDRSYEGFLERLEEDPNAATVRVLVNASERLRVCGLGDRANLSLRAAQRIADACQERESGALVRLQLGVNARREARLDDARQLFAEARAMLEAGLGIRALVLRRRAEVFLRLVEVEGPSVATEDVLRLSFRWFRRRGQVREAAFALHLLAREVARLGRRTESLRHARGALALTALCNDPGLRADCLLDVIFALWERGKSAEVSLLAKEAEDLVRSHHDLDQQAALYGMLALVKRDDGRLDEALVHARAQWKLSDSAGHLLTKARALQNLGVLLREKGDFEGAREQHLLARELFLKSHEPEIVANTYVMEAVLDLARGDRGGARARIHNALEHCARDSWYACDALWVAWAVLDDDDAGDRWKSITQLHERDLKPVQLVQRTTIALDDALRAGERRRALGLVASLDRSTRRLRPQPEEWELPSFAEERLLRSSENTEGFENRLRAACARWREFYRFRNATSG